MPEIEEFFEILGLQKLSVRAVVRNTNIHPPEEFSIPGRPELESLFREYVIDYSRRSNEYRTGLPDTE